MEEGKGRVAFSLRRGLGKSVSRYQGTRATARVSTLHNTAPALTMTTKTVRWARSFVHCRGGGGCGCGVGTLAVALAPMRVTDLGYPAAGYSASSSAPPIAPFEQLRHALKIPGHVQRGPAHVKNEMGCPGLHIGAEFMCIYRAHAKEWRDGALDLPWIASDPGAPIVKYGNFMSKRCGVA